jgi:glycosyltransferase involved in cell wall biosynthesis
MQYYKIPEDKLRIIPHGVVNDKPKISKAKLESWNSLLQDKKIVLYFGVLSPRKGLEFLIRSYNDVYRKYPESVLVIAGFEPDYYRTYSRSLKTLTESLGLSGKVFFTGFVHDEDVHALFSLAEIIVLPYVYSVSASGPLSITIQYTKPLVATKTSFFTDVLTNEVDAILVSPRDSGQLAEAINRLLGNSLLKEALSENLTFKAQSFSWQKIAKDTLSIYFDLLRGSSNATS